jgi:hypothetical protein
MRKSKREIQTDIEQLTDEVASKGPPDGDGGLSEAETKAVHTVLKYRRQVADDVGVHLDDRAVIEDLLETALSDVDDVGALTVADLEAAAEEIEFEPGGEP